MKYTDNLNLRKPEQTEFYDVDDFNENADILDAEIQGIKDTFVKSVNGKEPDAGGNVNVKEYTHPNSGVTAGTYRSVTVNAQGHVTDGSNPTLPVANGGTGATTASDACANIGALPTTGGTMTGNITYNGTIGMGIFSPKGLTLGTHTDDGERSIIAVKDPTKAQITQEGTGGVWIRGWDGVKKQYIDFCVNATEQCLKITSATSTSTIDSIVNRGDNWIRYANGIQIVWYPFEEITNANVSYEKTKSFTFPVPFASMPACALNWDSTNNAYAAKCNVKTTGMTYYFYNPKGVSEPVYGSTIVIGRWK